jgi:hypothetical protein
MVSCERTDLDLARAAEQRRPTVREAFSRTRSANTVKLRVNENQDASGSFTGGVHNGTADLGRRAHG